MKIPQYRISLVRERSVPVRLTTPDRAGDVAYELLRDADREKLVVIYLNGRNEIVGAEIVAVGAAHGVMVTAKEVFRGAIVAGASAVILAHNHPSGDPTPSAEDIEMTAKMHAAGELLGVQVLDHVVVAPNGRHVSMVDRDLLPLKAA